MGNELAAIHANTVTPHRRTAQPRRTRPHAGTSKNPRLYRGLPRHPDFQQRQALPGRTSGHLDDTKAGRHHYRTRRDFLSLEIPRITVIALAAAKTNLPENDIWFILCPLAEFTWRSDRAAEGARLESVCTAQTVPRVRIPPSPPNKLSVTSCDHY